MKKIDLRLFAKKIIPLFPRLSPRKRGWILMGIGTLLVGYLLLPYPSDTLPSLYQRTIRVYDRHDRLLMEISPQQGGFTSFVPLKDVPQTFVNLLLFAEDRNFFSHKGVSFPAMARALFQNIRHGRIVSGGSSLSQQLVRIRKGRQRNTLFSKLIEIIEAYRMELHFTKEEILEAYINSVFMGNNIYGFQRAAEVYFGKPLSHLNELEMCALIAMLPAPTRYQPYRSGFSFTERARRLLARAEQNGIVQLSPLQQEIYHQGMLSVLPMEYHAYAPLFSLYALQKAKAYAPVSAISEIHTTFDLVLYTNLLPILENTMKSLTPYNAKHAALLMIDNPSSELRVMIGSLDFFDDSKGKINATLIRKQVGSVMKPFAYALALEKGIYHASSILPDIYTEFPAAIGKYIPKNFTRTYHGPTRFAVALASSYNVSAVHVAHTIGIEVFYDFLKNIGFDSLKRGPSFYGLGLVLGNADLSLFELAQGYTIFPKEGLFQPVRMLSSIVLKNGKRITITNTAPKRVLSCETTFLISHILSDLRYKIPAFGTASPIYFPFPVAVKTGTTKDFRDNCVVGYTPLHTIAIWVGNLYNEPMKELPAVAGAGLLLRNTELFLWNSGYPFPPFVASNMTLITQRVCALSGMIAHEGCSTTLDEIFTPDNAPSLSCDWHNKKGEITVPDLYQEWAAVHNIKTTDTSFAIIFPTRDAVFGIDRSMPLENQCIPLEVRGGDETTTWYDNGTFIGKGKHLFYQLSPGEHILVAEWKTIRDQVRILVIDE